MSDSEHILLSEFSLQATPEQTLTLENLKGRFSVIYFYPKDNTPGCTQEGQDFRDAYPQFQALNAQVFGVSKDSLKTHQNFKTKYAFPFELIADPDEVLCKMFDVIKLKKNYGKEYLGIERSTFLINPDLQLIRAWRKVKVTGHVEEVLQILKQYS